MYVISFLNNKEVIAISKFTIEKYLKKKVTSKLHSVSDRETRTALKILMWKTLESNHCGGGDDASVTFKMDVMEVGFEGEKCMK